MSKDQTVTFTDNVEVRDHNDAVEFKAKRGEVVTLNPDSAARWIRRNKALPGEHDIDPADGQPNPNADKEAQVKNLQDTKAKAAADYAAATKTRDEAKAALDELTAEGKTPTAKVKKAAEKKLTEAERAVADAEIILEKADEAIELAVGAG